MYVLVLESVMTLLEDLSASVILASLVEFESLVQVNTSLRFSLTIVLLT